jgi:LacI family transcriptional regulator, galactose operon repressor
MDPIRRTKGQRSPRSDLAGAGDGDQSRDIVTLRRVAEAAGVHVSTASRALDPAQAGRISADTVARVEAAAESLSYTPDLVASGLARRRTGTVAVIVSDFDNPYSGRVIRGVSGVLDEPGLVALVAETQEDRGRLERVLRHLISRRVDAIVTTAVHLHDGDLVEPTRRSGVPVVLAGRSLPGSAIPAVVSDDSHGASLAAGHLVDLGHEVVAQLHGPTDIDTFDRRGRGFRARVVESSARDASVPIHARAPTVAEGHRLMRATLNQDDPPTGVFAHNDLMAVGAIEALAAAGLSCPEDVSVVGFNDVPLAGQLSPALTTIRVAPEELGRSAGRIALELINDPGSRPHDLRLPALLITRESTAAPR